MIGAVINRKSWAELRRFARVVWTDASGKRDVEVSEYVPARRST